MTTKISWTNETWNPVTGCSKVSPGCAHCYAERLSLRFGHSKKPWTPQNAQENVVLHPERLEMPLHWKKPRMVFVNSMSDLFHELVPDEFIDQVFAIMALTPQHTYQVLTKRPERMLEYIERLMENDGPVIKVMGRIVPDYWFWLQNQTVEVYHTEDGHVDEVDLILPLPNVWLGTSVENQHWADVRIPYLIQTPAAVRFLSCEPLLGPINLARWFTEWVYNNYLRRGSPIHWVIAGGESGPGYRTMDLDWARALRDQCLARGVPFFFKQQSGPRSEMNPELDGREWHEFPIKEVMADVG